MQKRIEANADLIFIVETCQNCKEHHWNTRHDEAKYDEFYNKGKYFEKNNNLVANSIMLRLPGAVVLRNQIPKSYLPYDLYCNLIPNEDENNPIYSQVPRTGAFEVSYKGMVINCYLTDYYSSFFPNYKMLIGLM